MKVAARTESAPDFGAARDAVDAGKAIELSVGEQHLEVEGETAAAVLDVIEQAARGASVVVTVITGDLTTGQVADLLGVSRPTVVGLVDSGALDGYKVGTHRRIRAVDALAYRDRHRSERGAAMDELVALSEELGLYDA